MAVVDANFRVYGTTNLRVVDASISPRIPGFFIVTSVYMLSEKASDVILVDAQGLVGAYDLAALRRQEECPLSSHCHSAELWLDRQQRKCMIEYAINSDNCPHIQGLQLGEYFDAFRQ